MKIRTIPEAILLSMREVFPRESMDVSDRVLRSFEGWVHELSHAELLGIILDSPEMFDEITGLLDIAKPHERDLEELTAQAVEIRVLAKLGIIESGHRGCYPLLSVLAFNVDGGTVPFSDRPKLVLGMIDDDRVTNAARRVLAHLRKRLREADGRGGP